jgi:hypothetical protein
LTFTLDLKDEGQAFFFSAKFVQFVSCCFFGLGLVLFVGCGSMRFKKVPCGSARFAAAPCGPKSVIDGFLCSA